ncbi:MAG: transglycosylase domain-containing protein [Chloroflexi bacterium]|nr:transglycosylase domain-containing protein [Chloroflexota bacterium]
MSALPFLRRRRKRHTLERQVKQNRLTSAMISIGLSLSALMGVIIIGGAFAYAAITADLPALEMLPTLLDPVNGSLLQPTRIYDRSGTHLISVLAPQDAMRVYVPYDNKLTEHHIPDTLAQATIALIDPGFWSHPGYLLDGISNPDEHATLAQKLVANMLLWEEPANLRRAIRERILAGQLTSHFGRNKIIEWYLNSANYGHFAYGAESAAQLYLGKSIGQINLAEAALLASVNESPAINPLDAPQAALQRQQAALILIQTRGMATSTEIKLAQKTHITLQEEPTQPNGAPAFNALVLSQIESRFNRTRIEQGGLQIITTLDYDLQQRSECAIQALFARLDSSVDTSMPIACDGAEMLPPLPPGQNAPESASAAVLDPNNGQLLALIGDWKNKNESTFLTPHRPGTLLTPFLYLTGFTRGLAPATLMWDLPPENSIPAPEGRVYQGPLRLRSALANDSLAPAAQLFGQMGAGLVQQTMAPFGLDISASDFESLVETENRYSVIQIAQSYGVFAAQGTLIGQPPTDTPAGKLVPSTILALRDLTGHVYAEWSSQNSEQIVSPQLAYLVTDALSTNLPNFGRPMALKTGVTSDLSDTWAAGYTPHRIVVVWMGGQNLSQRPVTSLWTAIMNSASRDVPPDNWVQPSGMLRLKVCDPSGMLPSEACPNIIDEIFIDGYQPTQIDSLFRSYDINRETGLLATVFTPEQLVEKRVFMQVPPEALSWAKNANLPIPPNQYDNIQPPAANPDATIAYPGMFATLQGNMIIKGTAGGENFSYYRLQYGQGLNPQNWTQVGSDEKGAVRNGKLAEWDTTGLKGLYSLQLLVVRTDHSLQTATVQITLNSP